jgi:hypothetical protein
VFCARRHRHRLRPAAAGQRGVLAQAAHVAHAGLRRSSIARWSAVIVLHACPARFGSGNTSAAPWPAEHPRCGDYVGHTVGHELLPRRRVVDRGNPARKNRRRAPHPWAPSRTRPSGLELRVPRASETRVLAAGLGECGMYGALMKVMPKRLVPEAGCSCGWPRKLKGLRVQRRVAADPEDRAMRLAGIEAAEVAAPAAQILRPPPNPPPPPPPPNPPPKPPPPKPPPPPNRPPPPPAGFQSLRAESLHASRSGPYPRRPAGSPRRLSADGHRIAAEVRVARNRRQRRSSAAPARRNGWAPASPYPPSAHSSGSGSARRCRPVGESPAPPALALPLLLLLLRAAREASMSEKFTVWSWLARSAPPPARPAQSRELRANHVAPILRNRQRPGAGDVGGVVE